MAAATKHFQFALDLGKGVHNLLTGALTVALCATAPTTANAVLADLTQISYTNLSTRVLTVSTFTQSSGVAKLVIADLVLTASGGSVAAFRYVDIYNDTPTSPADPLIAWYDYGSSLTLADTETLTLDFDGTNGFLQIS